MTAILRRELASYFNSLTGYLILAVFWFFSGMFFHIYCLFYDNASLSPVFSQMMLIIVFLVPIMTMRSFSEERRRRTDQALLTAPVSLFGIVMGKFLAAFVLFALCNAIYIVYAVFIAVFTAPDWVALFTTLLGTLLAGAALIAIDLFISSLTESQAIAAVFAVGVGVFIYMTDALASLVKIDFVKSVISSISFNRHYSAFTSGVVTLSGVVFFLCVAGLFLFLCVRVFDKRRWS